MNGFFNVNKPLGISSAKAVWLLKKKFNIKDKIGHMGTLDPNATGVLVIGVGRANRLFDVLLDKKKTYIATFTFGYQTATLDSESDEIVATSEKIPTKQEILDNVHIMLGKQEQVAPEYSAKNINGVRAYMLARQGKDVEIKPHIIEIYKFDLLEQKNDTTFVFKIECSSGTYIRSICRDFANGLQSVATMTALNRINSGVFNIGQSKTIEEICEDDIISVDYPLQHFPILELDMEQIKKIRNGIKLQLNKDTGLYRVYDNSQLVGLAIIDNSGITTMKIWLI